MITKQQIEKLVQDCIQGTDLYIVELNVKAANQIYIFVDSFEGVGIDDCVKISRYVENLLDREVEDLELYVSSAGLDLPFKVYKQYQKNIGQEVKIVRIDGEVLKGIIKAADATQVSVELHPSKAKSKKNKAESNSIVMTDLLRTMPYTEIKETKIVISFK
ncbi:MAG: ribosome assembly cofactor RimP [Bacteroidales bacterium]